MRPYDYFPLFQNDIHMIAELFCAPRSVRRIARAAVLSLLLAVLVYPVQAQQRPDGPPHALYSRIDLTSLRPVPERLLPDIEETCGLTTIHEDVFTDVRPEWQTNPGKAAPKQSATIIVDYGPGFDSFPEARAAFQRAVETWENHISTPVEIRVNANFESLGGNTLGGAGPDLRIATLDDGTEIIVAVNLLEANIGQAIEEADPSLDRTASDYEITARFNSDFDDWHFGEEPAPAGRRDFESVVLHEIGHGLNFSDTFQYNDSNDDTCNGTRGQGCYGLGTGIPGVYDLDLVEYEVATGAETPVVSFRNNSQRMGDVIQVNEVEAASEQIRFTGGFAEAAGAESTGPVPPRIYAPDPFESGSSIAHLDEDTYDPGDPNALMTPFFNTAETARVPGPIMCGMFFDLGWPMGDGCLQYRFFSEPVAFAATAAPEDGNVQLSWVVSPNADIQSYTIEQQRFDGSFQTVETLSGSATPEVTVDGLGLGEYTFRLRYTRGDGTSGQAEDEPTATIGFLSFDVDLTAGSDDSNRGQAQVQWSVPPNTSGYRYVIDRADGGTEFQEVGDVSMQTEFVDDGLVDDDGRGGLFPGTYTYRIRAVDGQGNTLVGPEAEDTLPIDGDVVAVGPYPNPVASGFATVTVSVSQENASNSSQTATVELYSILGQRVSTQTTDVATGRPTDIRLDVSTLASGMYFVRIEGETFSTTRRLAVAR